jgi:hypothetical protein
MAEEKEEKAAAPQEGSKPTPTQDENDSAAMGDHVMNKEPDGSPEEESPAVQMQKHEEARKAKGKQSEARPTQSGYQTRTTQAQHSQHRPTPQPRTSGE